MVRRVEDGGIRWEVSCVEEKVCLYDEVFRRCLKKVGDRREVTRDLYVIEKEGKKKNPHAAHLRLISTYLPIYPPRRTGTTRRKTPPPPSIRSDSHPDPASPVILPSAGKVDRYLRTVASSLSSRPLRFVYP